MAETKHQPSLISADIIERRRHARVDMPLKARFLGASGEERPCLVTNVSAGGALLRAAAPPRQGEQVVLYIDDVGRFEGKVVRSAGNEFAIDYRGRRSKNRRTADALTVMIHNRAVGADRRAAPRIKTEARAVLRLESGEMQPCSILDISLTGASLEIDPRPPLGSIVTLGKMTAKVVRRHEKGVGVVFGGPAKKMEEALNQSAAGADALHPVQTGEAGAKLASPFGKKNWSLGD
ncbi:MAG: PilZ domain-containing protein [Parvularculaceae bacterium]|jgi:hypothetical protein|nr:PilZ domain-containing protein [Parvularculaceae bacterium]